MTADRLQRLIAMKRATDTLGQLEYVDQLMTDVALWCQRPHDVERVAGILDHLIGRVVAVEPTTHAPERPLDRSHTDENAHDTQPGQHAPTRHAGAQHAHP